MKQRSLLQMDCSRPRELGLMSRQSFSWYSAPQISITLSVSSPTRTALMSISAPRG